MNISVSSEWLLWMIQYLAGSLVFILLLMLICWVVIRIRDNNAQKSKKEGKKIRMRWRLVRDKDGKRKAVCEEVTPSEELAEKVVKNLSKKH